MAATHESLAMLAAVRALDLDGVVSDVEIEETRAALRDAREMLANPLAYPPREEKDRAVVRQGAVEVRGREVRLGALDIENALILRCVGAAGSDRSRLGRRANDSPRTPHRLAGRDPTRDLRFSARSRRRGARARTRERRLGPLPGAPRPARRPIPSEPRDAPDRPSRPVSSSPPPTPEARPVADTFRQRLGRESLFPETKIAQRRVRLERARLRRAAGRRGGARRASRAVPEARGGDVPARAPEQG